MCEGQKGRSVAARGEEGGIEAGPCQAKSSRPECGLQVSFQGRREARAILGGE